MHIIRQIKKDHHPAKTAIVPRTHWGRSSFIHFPLMYSTTPNGRRVSSRTVQKLAMMLSGEGQSVDLLVDLRCESVIGNFEIIVHLEAKPKMGGVAKVSGQSQGGVGRDGALAMDDLIDPTGGNPKFSAEPVLADAHRREELFLQNFARMHGRNFVHILPLMIVHNLNIMGTIMAAWYNV
jgi:hypothetical protein